MSQKKSLQELTIKNNFMFAAVMMDPQNCQELLELILNIPISYVKVDTERSMLYDPRYRGIRMNVYVQDGHHTIFRNTAERTGKKCRLQESVRQVRASRDVEALQKLLKIAARADSIEAFEKLSEL